jgi:anti-sigma B factor antagonist
MSRANQLAVLNPPVTLPNGPVTVIQGPCSRRGCVLYIRGALQAPVDGDLGRIVGALLDRGERVIVLDLTQTSRIDAAGVGELVRAYNMAMAANGALRVEHPPTRISHILERVGLLHILRRG